MLAEVFKILRSTEYSTRIGGFKVQSANHFTIQPIESITKTGFETMPSESNGLAYNFLNHLAILSKRARKKTVCLYENFQLSNFIF